MPFRRTFQVIALLSPLLLFGLVVTSAYHTARLSLILNGYPFARVVPKQSLDIFQFVKTDSFSYQAVVFSEGRAVGMIDQPDGAFASFESFSGLANAEVSVFPGLFGILLWIAWGLRWFLLPVQGIVLLLWFRRRGSRLKPSSS